MVSHVKHCLLMLFSPSGVSCMIALPVGSYTIQINVSCVIIIHTISYLRHTENPARINPISIKITNNPVSVTTNSTSKNDLLASTSDGYSLIGTFTTRTTFITS